MPVDDQQQASTKVRVPASDVNIRKGHRAHVSKQTRIIQEISSEENYQSRKRKLLSLKAGLEKKLTLLTQLDERILEQSFENCLEAEIIRAAEIQDEIHEILFEINT